MLSNRVAENDLTFVAIVGVSIGDGWPLHVLWITLKTSLLLSSTHSSFAYRSYPLNNRRRFCGRKPNGTGSEFLIQLLWFQSRRKCICPGSDTFKNMNYVNYGWNSIWWTNLSRSDAALNIPSDWTSETQIEAKLFIGKILPSGCL